MTPTEAAEEAAPSYAIVLRSPGFARLYASTLLARTAQHALLVAIVLFVLARHHSPALAGTAAFLAVAPGLLLSPIAGALLDRHRRIRLIALDYVVAAVCLGLIGGLDIAGALPAGLLLVIVGLSSLTAPLSNTGTRSLFPLILPRRLWDRANALDSAGYVVAAMVGPAAVGGIVALLGGAASLLLIACLDTAAALVVAGAPEPPATTGSGTGVLDGARAGLVYVARSRSLRGLAACLSVYNLGFGIIVVALPLLVIDHLGGAPSLVGLMWTLLGAGGVVGAFFAGRLDTEGRERVLIAVGMGVGAAGVLGLAAAPRLWVAGALLLLFGATQSPIDVGLFSLRQRRTHPAWLGRAFAVSMSLNFSGVPVGSLLGGPLATWSVRGALVAAALACAAGAAVAILLVPARPAAGELALPGRLAPREAGGASAAPAE